VNEIFVFLSVAYSGFLMVTVCVCVCVVLCSFETVWARTVLLFLSVLF